MHAAGAAVDVSHAQLPALSLPALIGPIAEDNVFKIVFYVCWYRKQSRIAKDKNLC
jgi:hypothetical protein